MIEMSTIWRGICLDHNPSIEFDLFINGQEIKRAGLAVAEWRDRAERPMGALHISCDVVIGGYSYPLMSVVCPCGRLANPRVHDVVELRLVLAAAKSGLDAEVAEWVRYNACWPVERLTKLLGNGGPA